MSHAPLFPVGTERIRPFTRLQIGESYRERPRIEKSWGKEKENFLLSRRTSLWSMAFHQSRGGGMIQGDLLKSRGGVVYERKKFLSGRQGGGPPNDKKYHLAQMRE